MRIKSFLYFVLVVTLVGFTSCRGNSSKYADDVIRIIKNNGDDAASKIKPKPNPRPRPKQCKNCSGTGRVSYNGYMYECSNCGGDGKVYF